MKRTLAITLTALALTAAIVMTAMAGGSQGAQGAAAYPTPDGQLPAPQRIAHPIVLLTTRHHAIQLMQHGWWCTRDEPGVYECTPAQP